MSKLPSSYLDLSFLLPHGYTFSEKVLKNLKYSLVKVKFQAKDSDECDDLACQVIPRKNQFVDEKFIDAIKTIGHENIVDLHSIFQKQDLLYVFMEWIPGGNLLKYIKHNGYMEENQAKGYFQQMLKGLKHLHDIKLAHGNLSLTNILINKNSIKICDLKSLKDCREQTLWPANSKITQNIHFRAPEINLNEQYDPLKADIYSLGVILFVILNAAFPFNCGNLKDLIDDQQACRFSVRESNIHKLSIQCHVAMHIFLEPNATLRWNCDKCLDLDWFK